MPPFELAKAYAFHVALVRMEEVLGRPAYELLGEARDLWISKQVRLRGGGSPSPRAIRAAVARCSSPGWYPGKDPAPKPGRPPVYTECQKNRVAQVAMGLKRKLVRPTPVNVRAKMPRSPPTPRKSSPFII